MPDVQTLLERVEALEADACGAFVVDLEGRQIGSVFVEHNQVCWAAIVGLGQRLRDLLRDHLASSRQGGGPEEPVATRAAMLQHTIESLIALPDNRGETLTWVPHRHQTYHPRFAFRPVELLVAVNARLYATESAGADSALSLLDFETTAASYTTGDNGEPVPVRMSGFPSSIAMLVELGSWAEAAFGATRGFSQAVMARAVAMATGEITLAWRSGRNLIHAAVLSNKDAIERAVAALERRGYPAVLSRRTLSTSSHQAVRGVLGSVEPDR